MEEEASRRDRCALGGFGAPLGSSTVRAEMSRGRALQSALRVLQERPGDEGPALSRNPDRVASARRPISPESLDFKGPRDWLSESRSHAGQSGGCACGPAAAGHGDQAPREGQPPRLRKQGPHPSCGETCEHQEEPPKRSSSGRQGLTSRAASKGVTKAKTERPHGAGPVGSGVGG